MSHANNIQRTLEAMFRQKTNSSGIFRKSHGMQFARPGVTYVWFVFLSGVGGAVLLLFNGQWIPGIALLAVSPLLAAYIVDIQGFEVDFKKEKIRKYRSFLGFSSGEWLPLSSFDSVRVYKHELKTQRGKFISRGPKKYDAYNYYYVRLVSPGLNKSLSLLELDDYSRAKMQAEKIARSARLMFIEKPAKLKEEKV